MSDAARASRLPETVEEFLVWPGDSRAKHYELVDGVVRAMAPGSTTHATIQGNLGFLIGAHLRTTRSACRLLVTPGIVPRVNAARNFRVPDLGVTCVPDTARQIAMPEPILLVEILSPSNKAATWSNIWTFGSIPSLREILVVQSIKIEAQILRRGDDGGWPDNPSAFGEDDNLVLASLGLSCAVTEFYTGTHFLDARRG
ncbi:MAG TPA: Uma2 family endonuclease [Lichenihabitans sp.]|jgi:Uma2 family endonuclease|nr:Uma2 family endonuclease [Lichenihabitans sp.]